MSWLASTNLVARGPAGAPCSTGKHKHGDLTDKQLSSCPWPLEQSVTAGLCLHTQQEAWWASAVQGPDHASQAVYLLCCMPCATPGGVISACAECSCN